MAKGMQEEEGSSFTHIQKKWRKRSLGGTIPQMEVNLF
jgi:hypothetical protein